MICGTDRPAPPTVLDALRLVVRRLPPEGRVVLRGRWLPVGGGGAWTRGSAGGANNLVAARSHPPNPEQAGAPGADCIRCGLDSCSGGAGGRGGGGAGARLGRLGAIRAPRRRCRGCPPPFLGTAVAGGGGLTAAIDAYGDVVDLRAPSPAGRALIDNPAGAAGGRDVAGGHRDRAAGRASAAGRRCHSGGPTRSPSATCREPMWCGPWRGSGGAGRRHDRGGRAGARGVSTWRLGRRPRRRAGSASTWRCRRASASTWSAPAGALIGCAPARAGGEWAGGRGARPPERRAIAAGSPAPGRSTRGAGLGASGCTRARC